MRKYIAEFIGTLVLVTMGCGTAMLVGCDAELGGGYILTALAFGLSIVAMAYSIGNISGCHINPAVSLGVLISGGMDKKDFCGYVIAQILGGFAGAGILAAIFKSGGVTDMTGGFGANGLAGVSGSFGAGLLVEIILTFIFVMAILGVTDSKFKHGSFGGLIIGLTLTFVPLLTRRVRSDRQLLQQSAEMQTRRTHSGYSSSDRSSAQPSRQSFTKDCGARTSRLQD